VNKLQNTIELLAHYINLAVPGADDQEVREILEPIVEYIRDHEVRLKRLEERQTDLERRQHEVEVRIAQLEDAAPKERLQ